MPSSDAQFDRRLAAIFQAEAAEHVQRMQAGAAHLRSEGKGAGNGKALELLFRATHSLKGAARAVGRDAIETLCHALETLLTGLQRGRLAWDEHVASLLPEAVAVLERALAAPGDEHSATLLAMLARIEQAGRSDDNKPAAAALPAAPTPPHAPAAQAVAPTVRAATERLGDLLPDIEELVAAKLGGQQLCAQLDGVLPSAALRNAMARQQRQLAATVDALLEKIKSTLLLPVASLTPFLVATVRELAASEGKDVALRLHGDDVEVDRRLLEQLREPLVHLLRNAIYHGIEPPPQRAALAKPAPATVDIAVRPGPGGRVVITVADDGAGVDTARLAQAAREQGLAVPEQPTEADLLPLVFGSGVSTAPRLTRVAGRGLGLAIVRDTVERLGGTVMVASTPGQGTRFTMNLPLSLATFRALEVTAGQRSYLVPTSQVERCVRRAAAQVRNVGTQQTIEAEGQHLPLASLAALLELPPAAPGTHVTCLLLRLGEQRVAVAVDAVHGEHEVLSKPVERGLTTSAIVAGAAALGPARTLPILNAAELVRLALRPGRSAAAPLASVVSRSARRILLAEDSITSRTLLKNILEMAGHEVDVAVDGAQALAKLREAAFDLLVSDIEMPQMDGIALTEAVRSDPALRELPVVLVTSLGSPGDRERGAEAGADAYIVKSSFEQGDLLRAIEELL